MRNRLAARLQRAIGLRNDPLVVILITQIANANYPLRPDARSMLMPIIDRREIRRLTRAFLEHGCGTIDGLYHAIWGMSASDYVARLDEQHGSTSP